MSICFTLEGKSICQTRQIKFSLQSNFFNIQWNGHKTKELQFSCQNPCIMTTMITLVCSSLLLTSSNFSPSNPMKKISITRKGRQPQNIALNYLNSSTSIQEVYISLFSLIGNYGGFNYALSMVTVLFMFPYSSRMYQSHLM